MRYLATVRRARGIPSPARASVRAWSLRGFFGSSARIRRRSAAFACWAETSPAAEEIARGKQTLAALEILVGQGTGDRRGVDLQLVRQVPPQEGPEGVGPPPKVIGLGLDHGLQTAL